MQSTALSQNVHPVKTARKNAPQGCEWPAGKEASARGRHRCRQGAVRCAERAHGKESGRWAVIRWCGRDSYCNLYHGVTRHESCVPSRRDQSEDRQTAESIANGDLVPPEARSAEFQLHMSNALRERSNHTPDCLLDFRIPQRRQNESTRRDLRTGGRCALLLVGRARGLQKQHLTRFQRDLSCSFPIVNRAARAPALGRRGERGGQGQIDKVWNLQARRSLNPASLTLEEESPHRN